MSRRTYIAGVVAGLVLSATAVIAHAGDVEEDNGADEDATADDTSDAPSDSKSAEGKSDSDSKSENDPEVQKLIDQAMLEDYLKLDFEASAKKLKKAAKLCAESECAQAARIHADLAAVYLLGIEDEDKAKEHIAAALEADPDIEPEPEFNTPRLEKAWKAVKDKIAASKPEPSDEPSDDVKPASSHAGHAAPISSADCPPDFPGCGEGNGSCMADGDCANGSHCDDGKCVAPTPVKEGPQNWFMAEFQQDFMIYSADDAVCSGGNQYYCYYEGDAYYEGLPYAGDGNQIAGGLQVANQRLMVGYDRALANLFTLGARIGYSFSGGPEAPDGRKFLPVYAEGRFAYHFLENPFARTGLSPYLFISGGVAESQSRIQLVVYDGEGDYRQDKRTTLNAWRQTGIGFASFGAGTQIKFTDWTGLSTDFRVTLLYPAIGGQIAARAGYFLGF